MTTGRINQVTTKLFCLSTMLTNKAIMDRHQNDWAVRRQLSSLVGSLSTDVLHLLICRIVCDWLNKQRQLSKATSFCSD